MLFEFFVRNIHFGVGTLDQKKRVLEKYLYQALASKPQNFFWVNI